jgi:hypothetical protein
MGQSRVFASFSVFLLSDEANPQACPHSQFKIGKDTKATEDHFTAKPKVGPLQSPCQGQGKCRWLFDFLWYRHP